MKYKTIIELECEAKDKDEATNIAGEYLKGDIEFGVNMYSSTSLLWIHSAKRYVSVCLFALIISSSIFLNVTKLNKESGAVSSGVPAFGTSGVYTVVPMLKTQHKAGFKQEWEEKKSEAILDYLKD